LQWSIGRAVKIGTIGRKPPLLKINTTFSRGIYERSTPRSTKILKARVTAIPSPNSSTTTMNQENQMSIAIKEFINIFKIRCYLRHLRQTKLQIYKVGVY